MSFQEFIISISIMLIVVVLLTCLLRMRSFDRNLYRMASMFSELLPKWEAQDKHLLLHDTCLEYGFEKPHDRLSEIVLKGDVLNSHAERELYDYLKEHNVNASLFYSTAIAVSNKYYGSLAKLLLASENGLSENDLSMVSIRPIVTALAYTAGIALPKDLLVDFSEKESDEVSAAVELIKILHAMSLPVKLNKDMFYDAYASKPDVELNAAITRDPNIIRSFYTDVVGAYWEMADNGGLLIPMAMLNSSVMRNKTLPCPIDDVGGGVHQVNMVRAVLTAYSIMHGQPIPTCFVYYGKLTIQVLNMVRSTAQPLRVI